jgi:hypothetical protein
MGHKYKEVSAASAEVLGMVLAYMDEKEDVSLIKVLILLVVNLMSSMLLMIVILYLPEHFGDSGRSCCRAFDFSHCYE